MSSTNASWKAIVFYALYHFVTDGLRFGNGLALNRRQAIAWTTDDPVKSRIYALPRLIELQIKFDYHQVK